MRVSVSVWLGICAALCAAPSASALDELWRYEAVAPASSLPLIADADGDGALDVVFASWHDGALTVLTGNGAALRRFQRRQWLEGGVAAFPRRVGAPRFAFQGGRGELNLSDFAANLNLALSAPGTPALGTMPCVLPLDGRERWAIVTARTDGTLTAFDGELAPLWRFEAGAPLVSSPAGAPLFAESAAIYAHAADGRLFCLTGAGEPVWSFRTTHPAPRPPVSADPLVAELEDGVPLVIVSDEAGWLYGVGAVDGVERWRAHAGTASLGNPAVAEVFINPGRELVVVSETGEIAVIDRSGDVMSRGALPPGAYVPRPLIADVSGDGALELVIPRRDWSLVVADLTGEVRRTVPLEGSAVHGLALADLLGDGRLELIAATDCARVHCFATRAREGWTHPRGGVTGNGVAGTLTAPRSVPPRPPDTARHARVRAAALTEYTRDNWFGSAVIEFSGPSRAARARLLLRQRGAIIGAAEKDLEGGRVSVPCIRRTAGTVTVDAWLFDRDGAPVAALSEYPIRPARAEPLAMPAPEAFERALSERGAAYSVPERWRPPVIAGQDLWPIARYMPETWAEFGLDTLPAVRDAARNVYAPAATVLSLHPGHPAWSALAAGPQLFFIMSAADGPPQAAYPRDTHQALVETAQGRFLGYQVADWAREFGRGRARGDAPRSPDRAFEAMRTRFRNLLDLCHGEIYAGQSETLFHHQAFAWGAPMAFARVGGDVPCTALHLAFLRGAARQYGGRPWGVALANPFQQASADTRHRGARPRVSWSPPAQAAGPDCGHSPSLEFRLAVAAHLAGATFIHHESDAERGSIFMTEPRPGEFGVSPFGEAFNGWFEYARRHPERGIPYTPVAFMLDFAHGWQPDGRLFGIWPPGRSGAAVDQVFRHVFPWDGLDFEQGHLTAGPYGDVFDVITGDALISTLRCYGVIWPIGGIRLNRAQQELLQEYVRQGGVLVLDSAHAEGFPAEFLGARFHGGTGYSTQIQTTLRAIPHISTPYAYRRMRLARAAEPLAWTGEGEPLAAWTRHGAGVVIVCATEHWVDERHELLPLVPAIMRPLVDAFLPVSASANVQMTANRASFGWVIGLFNHRGVSKTPTRPAIVQPQEAVECVLRFRGRVPMHFQARLGEFAWSNHARGLQTRLGPGEVAVVEVRYSGQAAP